MKILFKVSGRKKIGLIVLGLAILGTAVSETNAQTRDPFSRPIVAVPKAKKDKTEKPKSSAPTAVLPPPIQQRIDSYKVIRQRCAELGIACPKPTSVLTLDEMQVTGIFRTPRGYAAMVEATPIKLSYTIYPGERFYDGQLVAIEESKLVFRRVTQMTNGKEMVLVDNKVLRQASVNDLASTRPESPTAPSQAQPNSTTASGAATTAPTQTLPADAVPATEEKDATKSGVAAQPGTPTAKSETSDGSETVTAEGTEEKATSASKKTKKVSQKTKNKN